MHHAQGVLAAEAFGLEAHDVLERRAQVRDLAVGRQLQRVVVGALGHQPEASLAGAQGFLGLITFGHVAGDGDAARLALGGLEDPGAGLEPAPGVVGMAQPVDAGGLSVLFEDRNRALAVPARLLGNHDVVHQPGEAAFEDRLHRVAGLRGPAGRHEQDASLGVELDDDVHGVLGQQPEALLLRAQIFYGAALLGDVDLGREHLDRATVGVVGEGRKAAQHPAPLAVLAKHPVLGFPHGLVVAGLDHLQHRAGDDLPIVGMHQLLEYAVADALQLRGRPAQQLGVARVGVADPPSCTSNTHIMAGEVSAMRVA